MSNPESSVSQLDGDSVRTELQRILASDVFAHAPIQSRLLDYLVQLELAGNTVAPKEYTIGVDALQRGASFDPRVDTIVRVQARRLRERLSRYYAEHGRMDPVCITVPKGHYRVEIAARVAGTRQAFSTQPEGSPRAHAAATHAGFRINPGTVPAPRLPLIGRAREVSELSGLLAARHGPRLITLTGTGGSGKTRLAIEVGLRAECQRSGSVYYVPLAGVASVQTFQLAMLRVFGLSAMDNAPPIETVCRHLSMARRRVRLILDNFEHLAAAAPLVGALLDATRRLQVVVTSRTALHLYGEHEYHVAPLPVPAADTTAVAELVACPSVELFVQRATAVQAGFALTPANVAPVAELCRRFDGLPLGIELAAAQCRVMTPAELVGRLPDRLDMRADNVTDVPDRQRTLRDVIAWSHQLLGGPEKTLFRRLAVFAGGFTVTAAEAVANARGDLGVDVEAGIMALLSYNLLYTTAFDPGRRYRMLSTVRAYALERLTDSGERDRLQQEHARYCLALAEAGTHCAGAARRRDWLARCDQERDNLQVALDDLLEHADAERTLRLICALYPYWQQRKHIATARHSIEAALRRFPPDAAPAWWAKAACHMGDLAERVGDSATARDYRVRALAAARKYGDHSVEAMVLARMATRVRVP